MPTPKQAKLLHLEQHIDQVREHLARDAEALQKRCGRLVKALADADDWERQIEGVDRHWHRLRSELEEVRRFEAAAQAMRDVGIESVEKPATMRCPVNIGNTEAERCRLHCIPGRRRCEAHTNSTTRHHFTANQKAVLLELAGHEHSGLDGRTWGRACKGLADKGLAHFAGPGAWSVTQWGADVAGGMR